MHEWSDFEQAVPRCMSGRSETLCQGQHKMSRGHKRVKTAFLQALFVMLMHPSARANTPMTPLSSNFFEDGLSLGGLLHSHLLENEMKM